MALISDVPILLIFITDSIGLLSLFPVLELVSGVGLVSS